VKKARPPVTAAKAILQVLRPAVCYRAMFTRLLLAAPAAAVSAAALFALPAPLLAQPAKQSAAPQQKPPAQKAAPAGPQLIGEAESWKAYTYPVEGGKICYLVGKPAKSEAASAKRGAVNALVTHNTADKSANVVSFIAGYNYPERADADLNVDNHPFRLFTAGDRAWARDSATDKAIVEAMAKGKQAVGKGAPAKGQPTTDSYALAGFKQALAMIDKACGIKR
jgi:hypothetical protein